MDNLSLYRKYRPGNFENLIGQEHIKTILINALKADRIAHAYLFSGPRGTGKTSTARLMAKALNCTNLKEGFEPCDECEFCKDIAEGKLIDIIEIDAASNRGIDEVRDLNEKIRFAPTRSKYKVYIVDEVHMMTKEAFNALLKTLEEPPEHVYFILATTEIHKIPKTIISRCQRFDFKRIVQSTIIERLKFIAESEGIIAEDKAIEAIAYYVDGGMRDAIGLFQQLSGNKELKYENVKELLGLVGFNLLNELFTSLKKRDPGSGIKVIHDIHNQGSDLKNFTHEFLDLLRKKMLEAVASGNDVELSDLLKMIEVFQEAYGKLNLSIIPQLPLEIAVVKIAGNVTAPVVSEGLPVAGDGLPVAGDGLPVAGQSAVKSGPVAGESAVKSGPVAGKPGKVSDAKFEKSAESIGREHRPISGFDLTTVRKNWPIIIEKIKNPALRMSVKNGYPIKIEGVELILQFRTNFHRERIMAQDGRAELEEILKESFGHPVKITASLVVEDYVPDTQNVPVPVKASSASVASEASADEDLLDTALDIFGGEVVE